MLYILVVFNKRNTARVAACWFIIYYRLVMHGNSNIKKKYALRLTVSCFATQRVMSVTKSVTSR